MTSPRLGGLRILVVDDGADNQLLFSLYLTQQGAEVTLAGDGADGLQATIDIASDGSFFHVILLDMQMPVMDGYELARRLRDSGYTRPVVALTAHSADKERSRCLEAGCDDFVTKPLPPEALIEAVLRNCGPL
ncbi:MAG: response regulator [Longimicrobiales bacterium]